MNINLHIETLIVDDLGGGEQQYNALKHKVLKKAVEVELKRQLMDYGIGFSQSSSAGHQAINNDYQSIKGGSFSINPDSKTETIGKNIANAIYNGIGN